MQYIRSADVTYIEEPIGRGNTEELQSAELEESRASARLSNLSSPTLPIRLECKAAHNWPGPRRLWQSSNGLRDGEMKVEKCEFKEEDRRERVESDLCLAPVLHPPMSVLISSMAEEVLQDTTPTALCSNLARMSELFPAAACVASGCSPEQEERKQRILSTPVSGSCPQWLRKMGSKGV
ncbi:unnamed protein product [Pleuronectes platessa]|uniref:Uncharacterized protein n=1 Tax=Pleuronectes platessa TaxID=8262 RepID=A0A9N7YYZ4_PLEPL|nr:unnamed protein product [Pleuronectes platessa]